MRMRGREEIRPTGVGTSADAARKSACATVVGLDCNDDGNEVFDHFLLGVDRHHVAVFDVRRRDLFLISQDPGLMIDIEVHQVAFGSFDGNLLGRDTMHGAGERSERHFDSLRAKA